MSKSKAYPTIRCKQKSTMLWGKAILGSISAAKMTFPLFTPRSCTWQRKFVMDIRLNIQPFGSAGRLN